MVLSCSHTAFARTVIGLLNGGSARISGALL